MTPPHRNTPVKRLERAIVAFQRSDWTTAHAGRLSELSDLLTEVSDQIEKGLDNALLTSRAEQVIEELSE